MAENPLARYAAAMDTLQDELKEGGKIFSHHPSTPVNALAAMVTDDPWNPHVRAQLLRAQVIHGCCLLRQGVAPVVAAGACNPIFLNGRQLPGIPNMDDDFSLKVWLARVTLNCGLIKFHMDPHDTATSDMLRKAKQLLHSLAVGGHQGGWHWYAVARLYWLHSTLNENVDREAGELLKHIAPDKKPLHWHVSHLAMQTTGWRRHIVPGSGWFGTNWLFPTRAGLNPIRDLYYYD